MREQHAQRDALLLLDERAVLLKDFDRFELLCSHAVSKRHLSADTSLGSLNTTGRRPST